MQQRFLRIWPYFVFMVGMLAGLQFWPASYWLEVPSIKVNDGRDPKNISMLMDRRIHHTFNGSTAIAVSKWEGEWVVICSGSSGTPGKFLAGAKLPQLLTMGIWTSGQCLNSLEPGFQYTVSKTWTIHSLGLMPDKFVTQTSNPFNVWP